MEGRTRRRKVRLFQFMRKAWRGRVDTARVSSSPRLLSHLAFVGRWEDGRAIEARTNSWKERTLPTPARPVSVAQSTGPMSPPIESRGHTAAPSACRAAGRDKLRSALRRACRPVGRPQDRGNRVHGGRSPPPSRIPVRTRFPRGRWAKYRLQRIGVDKSGQLFFECERNQWVGGDVYPRIVRQICASCRGAKVAICVSRRLCTM